MRSLTFVPLRRYFDASDVIKTFLSNSFHKPGKNQKQRGDLSLVSNDFNVLIKIDTEVKDSKM